MLTTIKNDDKKIIETDICKHLLLYRLYKEASAKGTNPSLGKATQATEKDTKKFLNESVDKRYSTIALGPDKEKRHIHVDFSGDSIDIAEYMRINNFTEQYVVNCLECEIELTPKGVNYKPLFPDEETSHQSQPSRETLSTKQASNKSPCAFEGSPSSSISEEEASFLSSSANNKMF